MLDLSTLFGTSTLNKSNTVGGVTERIQDQGMWVGDWIILSPVVHFSHAFQTVLSTMKSWEVTIAQWNCVWTNPVDWRQIRLQSIFYHDGIMTSTGVPALVFKGTQIVTSMGEPRDALGIFWVKHIWDRSNSSVLLLVQRGLLQQSMVYPWEDTLIFRFFHWGTFHG